MADFLDAKVKEIDDRLRELGPLVEEHARLKKAREALSGVSGQTRRATRGRPRGSGTGRRGRPRGGNTRSKQTLELIRAQPGVTIPELAEAMSIKPNYLYRILPGLEKEGQVRREGKGWHTAG